MPNTPIPFWVAVFVIAFYSVIEFTDFSALRTNDTLMLVFFG